MAEPPKNYIVRNCLLFAYKALRHTERFKENSLVSPYEDFFGDVASALSPQKKLNFTISNTEVEGFYNKRFSEIEFMSSVQSRILSKLPAVGSGTTANTTSTSPPGSNGGGLCTVLGTFNQYSLLFTVVWELLSSQNSGVCNKLPKLSGKQLWEVFLKLDTECDLKIHVDDLVDLIVRIFQANGHNEQQENIKEWFCGEEKVDFWSFFSQLTEKFVGLLQVHVVQEIHTKIVSELLKEGRMEKKGHVVHNWKTRWFVLTASSLNYFESHDNLVLKGSVVINKRALVQNMPEFKARPHRFRVVCGETRNGTEISAPNSESMHEWIYTIRMAIKMHQVEGRNFLHKYRLSAASIPKLLHSASEEKILDGVQRVASPTHKALSSSKSVPLDGSGQVLSPMAHKNKPFPPSLSPIENSGEYKDAPQVPPQRFDSNDVAGLNSPPEVFDKEAFVEARRSSRKAKKPTRRHSSLEPSDVEHFESDTGVYALVNKSPKKKKNADREVASLLSPTVRAQLPPEANEQIENWEPKEEKKSGKGSGGYVQLDFHIENGIPKGKIKDDTPESGPYDPGKTKFGYSTVVFGNERSSEEAPSQTRPKKLPPLPPARYEGKMPKHSSDSKILYSDVNFGNGGSPTAPQAKKKTNLPKPAGSNVDYADLDFEDGSSAVPQVKKKASLPKAAGSNIDYADLDFEDGLSAVPQAKKRGSLPEAAGSNIDYADVNFEAVPQVKKRGSLPEAPVDEEDSPYVNVRHGRAPVVPPRRGIASPIVEQSPTVPTRKTN